MRSINVVAITAVINAVKNKIVNASDLVKKRDYDGKLSDIETE